MLLDKPTGTGTLMHCQRQLHWPTTRVDDLLPVERVSSLRVIDISRRADVDPDLLHTVQDVREHQEQHGLVPAGATIALHSGWNARPTHHLRYLNADEQRVQHSPGFAAEAAEMLLERDATCLATDIASLDAGTSTRFPVHDVWLGAGRFGMEGLARTGRVPASGAHVVIDVVPWQHTSGGPCRVLCLWYPRGSQPQQAVPNDTTHGGVR